MLSALSLTTSVRAYSAALVLLSALPVAHSARAEEPNFEIEDTVDLHVAAFLVGLVLTLICVIYGINHPRPETKYSLQLAFAIGSSIFLAVILETATVWIWSACIDHAIGKVNDFSTKMMIKTVLYLVWVAVSLVVVRACRTSNERLWAALSVLPHSASFVVLFGLSTPMKKQSYYMAKKAREGGRPHSDYELEIIWFQIQITIGGLVLLWIVAWLTQQVGRALSQQDSCNVAHGDSHAGVEEHVEARSKDFDKSFRGDDLAAGEELDSADLDANRGHGLARSDHSDPHWLVELRDDMDKGSAFVTSYMIRHIMLFILTGALPHPPWKETDAYRDLATKNLEYYYSKVFGTEVGIFLCIILVSSVPGCRWVRQFLLYLFAWMGSEMVFSMTVNNHGREHKAEVYIYRAYLSTFAAACLVSLFQELKLMYPSSKTFGRAAATVLEALGLGLGIAYESAFMISIEESTGYMIQRLEVVGFWQELVAPGVLLAIAAFLMPAWYFFVVPGALQAKEILDREDLIAERVSMPDISG